MTTRNVGVVQMEDIMVFIKNNAYLPGILI